MDRKYKQTNKNTWVIIATYGLLPLSTLLFNRNIDLLFLILQMAIYFLISIFLVRYHNRIIAEIENDVLIFYSGIGLNDPSKIDMKSIRKTERKAKNLLAIHYDGKEMSLEADKRILDQLEKDIAVGIE